jgi:HSP20 family protein
MAFIYRHPLEQFRGEMDRLLSGFIGSLPDGPWSGLVRGQPPVNLWEKDDALMMEMELPGVASNQIDISVVGNELTIKIDRPEAKEDQDTLTYHRRERPLGSFSRVLRLPVEVDPDKVEADLRDGVLTLSLMKAESAKPRKINVTST